MCEARRDALRVGFDRAIKLEFHGAKVSSDAGLFPYRDLDDAAQLTESAGSRQSCQVRRRYDEREAMQFERTIRASGSVRACLLENVGGVQRWSTVR